MLAVVETGGKQYLVKKGDTIFVEKLDIDEGKSLTLKTVLMLTEGNAASTKIGDPTVKSATVTAKVISTAKGDKVRVYKMKQRKRYRRNKGHRQWQTELEIVDVTASVYP